MEWVSWEPEEYLGKLDTGEPKKGTWGGLRVGEADWEEATHLV